MAAYLLHERQVLASLATGEPFLPVRTSIQRTRDECDVDRRGDRGSQHVEQLHSGRAGCHQTTVRLTVVGDDVRRGRVGRGQLAGADLVNDDGAPPVGSLASGSRAQVAEADAPGLVEEGTELPGAVFDVGFRQRHACPLTDGPRQEQLEFGIETDLPGRHPFVDGTSPTFARRIEFVCVELGEALTCVNRSSITWSKETAVVVVASAGP